MEHENSSLAECFAFYLAEQGFDKAVNLFSDDEHKKLITKQWNAFKSVTVDDV
jgi:hypothetical protein